ncbi:hypothetical protein DIPPA_01281 [Diplonema papillatum]|nr:hypothetical protein DIPPA_01281 [Diplonema papillatum]
MYLGCEDEYTKYYEANDLNHRFNGRSAQKNLDNMHGPNNQLHISNVPIRIPNATVEDALRKYSDNCTTRWIEVKATNEARTKMCIATMDSVRSAVAALVGLHTTSYGPVKGKGIVVSFKHSAPPKATVHPVDSSPLGLIPDPTRPTRHEPDTRYRRPTPDRYNGSGWRPWDCEGVTTP